MTKAGKHPAPEGHSRPGGALLHAGTMFQRRGDY